MKTAPPPSTTGVSEAKKFGYVAVAFEKLFPMPGKKWAFNLTHVLLNHRNLVSKVGTAFSTIYREPIPKSGAYLFIIIF